MKNELVQLIKPTQAKYLVVITCPQYKSSESATVQYSFNDFGEALDQFIAAVKDCADHITMVDTYRIIGLYSNHDEIKLKKQTLLTSIDK